MTLSLNQNGKKAAGKSIESKFERGCCNNPAHVHIFGAACACSCPNAYKFN